MSLTLVDVEALAPDQPSLAAAARLLKPVAWPLMACDPDKTLVWGEAQGSGSAPYRLGFVPGDRGYTCSCPSRKFPCKHVLALMWQWVEQPGRFTPGVPPSWAAEWLSRRKPGAGTAPKRDAAPISLDLVERPEGDAGAEAQAARRDKAWAARMAGVTDALDALDVWLLDQLHEGLATFAQRAQAACRAAAQRLVDGKAAGLALMLDELPATLFGLPEAQRPGFIAVELGRLHLVAAAFRRQEMLPAGLKEDARRAVGWSQHRDELLADPAAKRIAGTWTAVGARTVLQVDRLRRVETWLASEDGGQAAVLIDYARVSVPVAPAFAPGERFEAELAFYPSAVPLRAIVLRRVPGSAQRRAPSARRGRAEAVGAHHARRGQLAWGRADKLGGGGRRGRSAAGGLWLVDADGAMALPLPSRQADTARPLLGLALHTAALVWNGRVAELMSAGTSLGPWFDAP